MRILMRNIITAVLKNKSAVAIVAALFAITGWVYYNSLWYGFVYSDLPVIKHFVQGKIVNFWRVFLSQPRWISLLLNKAIFSVAGDSAFFYRLGCLILHLANGGLAFLTMFLAGRRAKAGSFLSHYVLSIASIVTLFMLLHPVQSQTVLHIAQMQLEGFILFFTLLALVATLLFAQAKTTSMKRWALLLFIAAVFGATGAKEIAVVMPLLILLFDWFFIAIGSMRSLLTRWYLHAISSGMIGAAFFWYGTLRPGFIIKLAHATIQNDRGNILTSGAQIPITLQPYALSQFKVLVHYLKIFIWPANLCYDYEMVLSQRWQDADVMLPALLCLGLLGLMVWRYLREGSNVLSFGIAWFFLTMVPRVSLFPTTELICDYKTYLASFGITVVFACLIIKGGRILFRAWPILIACGPRTVKACALAGLCYYVGGATIKRQLVWQDEYTFWKDVVEKAPKPRTINNFAVALWHSGEIDDAVDYFKKAIEKDHWYAEPHANLGTIYQVKGNEEKALYHYAKAVEIDDGHAQLFNNLGQLHVSRGSEKAAELCFKRAIALHAATPNAYVNLGRLYEQQQRKADALALYQDALMRRITSPELLYACGVLAYNMQELKTATMVFQQLDQAYEQTAFLLGCCYYDQKQYAQAATSLELASKKDPLNIKCIYHYAEALMHANRFREAAAMYSLCMTHEQVFASASLHKIYCLYRAGDKPQAQQQMASLLNNDLQPYVVTEALALQQKYLT